MTVIVTDMPTLTDMVFNSSRLASTTSMENWLRAIARYQTMYKTVGVHDSIIDGSIFFPEYDPEVKALKRMAGKQDPAAIIEWLREQYELDAKRMVTDEEVNHQIDALVESNIPHTPYEWTTPPLEATPMKLIVKSVINMVRDDRILVKRLNAEIERNSERPIQSKVIEKILARLPALNHCWSNFLNSKSLNTESDEANDFSLFEEMINAEKTRTTWEAFIAFGTVYNKIIRKKSHAKKKKPVT